MLDDEELAVGEAPSRALETVELSSASSDVFPEPTPTAGTFPFSLPLEVEA